MITLQISVQTLRNISILATVPEDQLQWLIDNSAYNTLRNGDYLFKTGDPMENTHIILEGKINFYFIQNNNQKLAGSFNKGDITGYLPYSRSKVAGGNGIAIQDTELLSFPRSKMKEMIENHHELTEVLVHVMTNRVRDFTQIQIQNEKLMALGKLSAGLAHELNNPASAILRSALELKKHLKNIPDNFKAVIKIKVSDEVVDIVNDVLFHRLQNKPEEEPSLIERTEKEDELLDWLEEQNVKNAYDMAENFIDFGFTCEDFERILEAVSPQFFPPVINWISQNLTTEKMVSEINEASQRIADLVGSIKAYSYMDKSLDLQEVDIHEGLKNTIMILKHKLKKNNIQFKKYPAENLPKIKGLPGELNQVWTNLIDNAIDAMENMPQGEGILEIQTLHEGDFVKVNIIDNGSGIPPEIKSRIFEPFFTTKEQGKGTGLGLDMVAKIMRQHNADIKVESVPGRTEFKLCFPIN